MRFKSVETTPNPNSMKLNFHESFGKAKTYSQVDCKDVDCPDHVAKLLQIDGVKSVFVCGDFITLSRKPTSDWKPILDAARQVFGHEHTGEDKTFSDPGDQAAEVQVQVLVQTFKKVPLQVKILAEGYEKRVSLEPRFNEAAMAIQETTGVDFLKERYWDDRGLRYGIADEIALEVADEINSCVDEKELERIKLEVSGQEKLSGHDLEKLPQDQLKDNDWHIRLQAVQKISEIAGAINLLIEAAGDPHPQVRRLVAAALGMTESSEALPVLCKMLNEDESVGVRRTAGDALSDIGDSDAEKEVVKALGDANKLVRWRAARFLFEVGTSYALPYLQEAREDSEYEVQLEIEAAIERISKGFEGSMPVWKKITKEKETRS